MKKCEKLFEKLKEDGNNANIFAVMHKYCPSDFGMNDEEEKCVFHSADHTGADCFWCWMDEVKE